VTTIRNRTFTPTRVERLNPDGTATEIPGVTSVTVTTVHDDEEPGDRPDLPVLDHEVVGP
jgi:hypothetical protein